MKTPASKGFTLIELLVVITIIGILATGATAVYTSAQQKARDSIRQNDVLAMRSAVEQRFGDTAQYPTPTDLYSGVVGSGYMQALPADPKTGNADAESQFEYVYNSARDAVTEVAGQEYEISANFENTGNASSKEGCVTNACDGGDAAEGGSTTNADGGQDPFRWEIGINMDNVDTSLTNGGTLGTNLYDGNDTSVTALIVEGQSS